MELHHIIGTLLLCIGFIFQCFGIYGLQRYKHFYVRLSISSLIDSAGLVTILIGLIFYAGWSMASLKIAFILFLVLLLNPLSNHILGRGAYMSNFHPERRHTK